MTTQSSNHSKKSSKSASSSIEHWARWKHLLFTSELIQEMANRPFRWSELLDHFDSLESAFPKSVDPIEEPQAYAVRQLIKALKDVLEHASRNEQL